MLDPAVLATLADLELVSRVVVDGTISGLHRSPFHGYSAEFSQYRHYRPGDDLKYVDWKLFARTDRLYTKQFRETTNLLLSDRARYERVDGVRGRERRQQVSLRAHDRWRIGAPARPAGRRRGPHDVCRRHSGLPAESRRADAPAGGPGQSRARDAGVARRTPRWRLDGR